MSLIKFSTKKIRTKQRVSLPLLFHIQIWYIPGFSFNSFQFSSFFVSNTLFKQKKNNNLRTSNHKNTKLWLCICCLKCLNYCYHYYLVKWKVIWKYSFYLLFVFLYMYISRAYWDCLGKILLFMFIFRLILFCILMLFSFEWNYSTPLPPI